MNTNPTLSRTVRGRSNAPRAEPDAVLTRAVLRSAELLGLSAALLARVLGVSEASVSRMAAGSRRVNPSSKEGELALLLVRAYRSLDALVGADDAQRRAWMSGHNHALGGTPIDLIQRADGLVAVVAYLDGMRAVA
jgi:transcriptional regulator with XRE-family HTH domain